MMRKANKRGARFAIIIGEAEQQNNQVRIKDMQEGTEDTVTQSQLITYLRNTT